jgi:hypothetical protein
MTGFLRDGFMSLSGNNSIDYLYIADVSGESDKLGCAVQAPVSSRTLKASLIFARLRAAFHFAKG